MKNKELFEVFCKALGLYFAMQAFINVKDTIIYAIQLQNGDQWINIFFIGQTLIFNGIAAVFLIRKSALIANLFFKKSESNLEIVFNKVDLTELIIITIGGIVVINSIPSLLSQIINFIYFNPYSRMDKNEYWTNRNTFDLIYFTFRIIVGLLVIANARLISGRIIKLSDKSDKIGGI